MAGADVNATGYKDVPLYSAVWADEDTREKVELILNTGVIVDVNKKSWMYGQTALHKAVETKRLNIVKLLLEHGARLDIADDYNQTPLDLAIERDCDEIVELLQNWEKDEQN